MVAIDDRECELLTLQLPLLRLTVLGVNIMCGDREERHARFRCPGVESDRNFAVNVLKLLFNTLHGKLGTFKYFITSLRVTGDILIQQGGLKILKQAMKWTLIDELEHLV